MIRNLLYILTGLVLGSAVANNVMGRIEGYFSPISLNDRGYIISNTDLEICWYTSFRKNRNGHPTYFYWWLKEPNEPPRKLLHHPPGSPGRGFTPDQTTLVGFLGRVYRCARKPVGVGNHFVLYAEAEYVVPWRPWRIPREIAPFGTDDN